jgi:anthranilate phosphoribosyltransferase
MVRLLSAQKLDTASAKRVFRGLFRGEMSEPEAKAVLLLLARKGESSDELYGCLAALRALEPPQKSPVRGLMDTCGTGGDSSSSIIVSTLAAFVVAGAGGHVAKHGNRAITSKCGSSDLMKALGVKLDAPAKKMTAAIRRAGIGYFHAPYYHPVFSRVHALRRMLKVRTIFNLLGPLANPFRLTYQLVGVSSRKNFVRYAAVLKKTGLRRAAVCHSRDGMDEISTRTKTDLAVIEKKRVSHLTIDPKRLGIRTGNWNYCAGGIAANRNMALRILSGRHRGPCRDVVVLNAGVALYIAGRVKTIREGVRLAESAIDRQAAYRAYQSLKRISNQ